MSQRRTGRRGEHERIGLGLDEESKVCGEQGERGFMFWVLRDPWENEFCVVQTEFPELLAQREPWPD